MHDRMSDPYLRGGNDLGNFFVRNFSRALMSQLYFVNNRVNRSRGNANNVRQTSGEKNDNLLRIVPEK